MADKKAKPRPVAVVLPSEPPRLTPGATRALLTILVKARERQVEEECRLEPSTCVEFDVDPHQGELNP